MLWPLPSCGHAVPSLTQSSFESMRHMQIVGRNSPTDTEMWGNGTVAPLQQ